MKRFATLLTLLALAFPAFAQGTLDPLPDEARFDERVEFSTGQSGESLPVMINALAKAVNLTAITDDVADIIIVYDIGDPKPFRQVWNIVLTLHDLDYVLLENDVIVVGSPESVSRLRTPAAVAEVDEAGAGEAAARPEQRFYRVNGDPEQIEQLLGRAIRGLDVEALPGVQTIVVMATPEDHERVTRFLDEYDVAAEQVALEQRTYHLSNAVAKELADVLTNTGVVGGEDSSRLEGFTVVADARTNSLIVTGPRAVQNRLAELIPRLDEPRKQVNVQVRIQEVAHSVTYDLGLDVTGGFGQLAASILDTGLSFVFSNTNPVSAFNITTILDALETQGLSRRVDDGSITVLDNQTGIIQSGGTIFITMASASENIEREIPYGVRLELTPRVAVDGSVTLTVSARVEDQLPPLDNPAYIKLSTRAVDSTISLQPGQTALLGGLMQSNFSVQKNRVPVLGSIPIIGELFGSTSSEDTKSDLLLIVTAQVID